MPEEKKEKRAAEIMAELINEFEEQRLLIKNIKDRIRILEEQISLLLQKKGDL